MKLLLLLEHIFFIDEKNGIILSEGVIDNNYLKRYLEIFDEIVICARVESGIVTEKIKKKFSIVINDSRISLVKLPFAISSKDIILNFNKTRNIFKNAINFVDRIIIRGPSLLSLLLYKECIGKKFAVEFVGGANKILDPKNFVRSMINNLLDKKAKNMCLNANGVAYVTEFILQRKYPSHSIMFGQSDLYFDASYSSLDLYDDNYYKQNWKLDDKPEIIKIVHIGNMASDKKGQLRLLKAGKILLDKGYSIEMHFLGDGKLKDELIEYSKEISINQYTTFYGNINDRNFVFEIIRSCHLFVLPSAVEGLPRSIIEAMANGLPCIASNVDGIPELIEKDYLVDYNDIQSIADKMENLINNWDKMIEISKRNYDFSQKFNYRYLKQKRNEFYLKLREMKEV